MTDAIDTLTLAGSASPAAVAGALATEITGRADESEALATMPNDLVGQLRAAGIFRALQPRSLGGFEVAPVEFVEMIEELARADGSAGWIAAIGAGAPAFSAWLEPDVATELFGSEADFTAAPDHGHDPDADRVIAHGKYRRRHKRLWICSQLQ